MKKMINKVHLEGLISEHTLELKKSQKGIVYIGGKIDIVTDDLGLNTVTAEFPYVAEKYNNGNENKTFAVLQNIITSGKTIFGNPGEQPTMIKVDPSISLNEWFRDENGTDVLVSTKRASGGFAHIITSLNKDEGARNTFETDIVITNTVFLEGNEEKKTQDKLVVKGCIFDFSNKLLPVEFSVLNPKGIAYFENLDATPNTPVFTKVWGKIINETIVETKVEESAFGDSSVTEIVRHKRDWVITGTSTAPYGFDEEGMITSEELATAIADRKVHLATLLQGQKEREAKKAQQNNAFTAAPTNTPAVGNFSF